MAAGGTRGDRGRGDRVAPRGRSGFEHLGTFLGPSHLVQ
jgi:hypothetical protein